MNRLDLVVLLVGLFAAIIGWRLGFARRVLSWAGIVAGLAFGSWLLPRLVEGDPAEPSSPSAFLASAALLLGAAFVGQLIGTAAGSRISSLVDKARLGRVDAMLGTLAGIAGVVFALWVLLPAMADVPGWPSREARGSTVAGVIDETLGDPPGVLDNLADTLGLDRLPRVFEDLQLSPEAPAPPPNSTVGADVVDRAVASTLKVVAEACGRLQSGSGFVVAPGLVVTNAHVVAGGDSIRVETTDGTRFAAEAVGFDPDADLALLRAPALDRPALPLSNAVEGDQGVVLGYPGGGDLTVAPFRIAEEIRAQGRDIYDRERVVRRVFVLGSHLEPGDSGGPLVNAAGEVVGVAFAIAPDRPEVAYAVVDDDVRELVAGRGDQVSTGECLS
ncbi:MAG TPA: MarP family serine protease [Microthrixaceae bacterium]|nr:MarP family serine protease [Microthrixaceae bacterium]